LLIDKHFFPRDKVCGDAIGSRAINVLKKIDPSLAAAFESFSEKAPSKGWKLVSPGGKEISVNFKLEGSVSRRMHFDNWLMQRVRESPEIAIKEGVEVESVRRSEDKIILQTTEHGSAECGLVIACDGAHSVVAKSLAGFVPDWKHYSGAVRAYYDGILGMEKGMIEIHLDKRFMPGYFWIFPLSESEANVGFGMLSSELRKNKIDLKSALEEIIRGSPKLAFRFAKANRTSDIRGFGLPLGGRKLPVSGERFMLCGDAASLIDPLNGEGIGNAMWSGMLAAEQAIACFGQQRFDASFLTDYDRRLYEKFLPELRKKLFLQRLFNRPKMVDWIVGWGQSSPAFRNWIARQL